jgi:hypothetical protein
MTVKIIWSPVSSVKKRDFTSGQSIRRIKKVRGRKTMKKRRPNSKPIRIIKRRIKLLNAQLPTARSISIQSVSNNTMSRNSLSI